MSTRTEILLIALAVVALSGLSGWVIRGVEGDEGSAWPIVFVVLCVLSLGIGALAWAGWGRWLLSEAGTTGPSRKWWRLWFVPWALWGVTFVARGLLRETERHGHPSDWFSLFSLPVMALAAAGALVGFVLVLTFAFREIGYLSRQRRARRSG